jgi:hypothetical protein
MSAQGKHIYLAIKADEKDLQKVAEDVQHTMQFAIGITDLRSLEPCSAEFYPLRMVETDNKNINDL